MEIKFDFPLNSRSFMLYGIFQLCDGKVIFSYIFAVIVLFNANTYVHACALYVYVVFNSL